jgi:hypothetical protein
MKWLVAIALMSTAPACTLISVGLTASTIGTHNEISDSHWSYTTPLLISAAIGLVVDIAVFLKASDMWSQPMT